jgi:hypothetical protein
MFLGEFTALDKDGQNPRIIPSVIKIDENCLDISEWEGDVLNWLKSQLKDNETPSNRDFPDLAPPKPLLDFVPNIFTGPSGQVLIPQCNICKAIGDEKKGENPKRCANPAECLASLRAKFVAGAQKVEIRDTGDPFMGIGAFVKAGADNVFRRSEPIGEYLGQIRHPNHAPEHKKSAYILGGPCWMEIDAGRLGNWTPFVNHHCQPNVAHMARCAGTRFSRMFFAMRDIAPGEQLFISYGWNYFASFGTFCRCSAHSEPHLPLPIDGDEESEQQEWYNKGKHKRFEEFKHLQSETMTWKQLVGSNDTNDVTRRVLVKRPPPKDATSSEKQST